MEKENIIKVKSYNFALKIVHLYKELHNENEYVLSKQLVRSATSVGANIEEGLHGQSKADFIHKFKISAKEIEETIYWLELCKFSNNYPNVDELLEQINNISRIANKIIITSKQK